MRLATFRSYYWKQVLAPHNHASDLLLAHQEYHRILPRYDRVVTEIDDLNRLMQTQENRQIAAALGILTILGLPVSTALGIVQILGFSSVFSVLIALGCALAATGILLLTPYGRTVTLSFGSILPDARRHRRGDRTGSV